MGGGGGGSGLRAGRRVVGRGGGSGVGVEQMFEASFREGGVGGGGVVDSARAVEARSKGEQWT